MRSMTGYGNSSYQDDFYFIDIEIKTLNNRFLDISINTNNEISHYEQMIRDEISKRISRGKAYVTVNVQSKQKPPIELDSELFSRLSEIYREAHSIFHGDSDKHIEIRVEEILKHEGVIVSKAGRFEDKNLFQAISKTLLSCLEKHERMTREEGNKTKIWLAGSLDRISGYLDKIEQHIPHYRDKLTERLKKVIQDILSSSIDKEVEKRLMVEVAFYIDRYDINEELVRLRDHLEKMAVILAKDEKETGKKMNFIVQEMQREIQTLSSKFNNIQVFPSTLAIKEEVEKCRELIQNVE